MGERAVLEKPDHWVLPFAGMAVSQLRVDHQLTLLLDGDAQITVEQRFSLTLGQAEPVDLDPDKQDVAPAIALFGACVTEAIAGKNGTLRVAFDNGAVLAVPPDPGYEAWGVTGPGGLRMVATPGGELAVWT